MRPCSGDGGGGGGGSGGDGGGDGGGGDGGGDGCCGGDGNNGDDHGSNNGAHSTWLVLRGGRAGWKLLVLLLLSIRSVSLVAVQLRIGRCNLIRCN